MVSLNDFILDDLAHLKLVEIWVEAFDDFTIGRHVFHLQPSGQNWGQLFDLSQSLRLLLELTSLASLIQLLE